MPKKLHNYQRSSGYTLIEILIALTIVGLIFGIGYVNFRDFARRQALSGTVRSLKGDLRLAQAEALTGKKPNDPLKKCVDPLDVTKPFLNGYNFFVVSSSTYTIEAACSGGNVEIKRVTLSSDMAISAPTPNPVLFKILGQGTNIGATEAVVTITQSGTGSVATINISSGGEIR